MTLARIRPVGTWGMEAELEEREERPRRPRLAWALTGSGHDFTACLEIIRELGELDLFLSKAAAEVIFLYTRERKPFPPGVRLIRDTTASAPPVGRFYDGWYHTLVVAPATSNTVAKFVCGISDTLVTNVFAQAGKCRIPIIVYACDTKPVHDSMAPHRMVRLWPRRIDLENTARLKEFEGVVVVEDMATLEAALTARLAELGERRTGRGG